MSATTIIWCRGYERVPRVLRDAATALGVETVAWPWTDGERRIDIERNGRCQPLRALAFDVARNPARFSSDLVASGFSLGGMAVCDVTIVRTLDAQWWAAEYAVYDSSSLHLDTAVSAAGAVVAGLDGVGLFTVTFGEGPSTPLVALRTPGDGRGQVDHGEEWSPEDWQTHVAAWVARATPTSLRRRTSSSLPGGHHA